MKQLAILVVVAFLCIIVAFGTYTEATFTSPIPEHQYTFYFPMLYGRSEHQYTFYLPMLYGRYGSVVPDGPGVGGCPWRQWERDELGVKWCYYWNSDCNGTPWCVPMLRHGKAFDVAEAMQSCGGPCNAVLLLNEPNLPCQDDCNAACQVEFLHTYYPQLKAINPSAVVVFGNFYTPSRLLLWQVIREWKQTYPDEPFPDVLIGVHHYAWAETYNRDLWRWQLDDFREYVRSLGTDIVLTEWGSLADEGLWYRVVEDHVTWLEQQGIPHAVFLWGQCEQGYFCQLWADGELTACGRHYQRMLRK